MQSACARFPVVFFSSREKDGLFFAAIYVYRTVLFARMSASPRSRIALRKDHVSTLARISVTSMAWEADLRPCAPTQTAVIAAHGRMDALDASQTEDDTARGTRADVTGSTCPVVRRNGSGTDAVSAVFDFVCPPIVAAAIRGDDHLVIAGPPLLPIDPQHHLRLGQSRRYRAVRPRQGDTAIRLGRAWKEGVRKRAAQLLGALGAPWGLAQHRQRDGRVTLVFAQSLVRGGVLERSEGLGRLLELRGGVGSRALGIRQTPLEIAVRCHPRQVAGAVGACTGLMLDPPAGTHTASQTLEVQAPPLSAIIASGTPERRQAVERTLRATHLAAAGATTPASIVRA